MSIDRWVLHKSCAPLLRTPLGPCTSVFPVEFVESDQRSLSFPDCSSYWTYWEWLGGASPVEIHSSGILVGGCRLRMPRQAGQHGQSGFAVSAVFARQRGGAMGELGAEIIRGSLGQSLWVVGSGHGRPWPWWRSQLQSWAAGRFCWAPSYDLFAITNHQLVEARVNKVWVST